jgi:L-lactate utilization protein LutB
MKELKEWLKEKQVARTIKALQGNGFQVSYFPEKGQAKEYILKQIPVGATVGIGGSLTLGEIGLFEELRHLQISLINPSSKKLSREEAYNLRRRALTADIFLTGSNALTEDGHIYNIDASGNRAGAMFFGPKKVLIVAGTNKIVKDVTDARRRIKEIAAPMNARRLGYKTPCADLGQCFECPPPESMCNVTVIIEKKPRSTEIEIVLIGETLGL